MYVPGPHSLQKQFLLSFSLYILQLQRFKTQSLLVSLKVFLQPFKNLSKLSLGIQRKIGDKKIYLNHICLTCHQKLQNNVLHS